MNLKKNIICSKKIIIFLFMVLCYITSYSSPVSQNINRKKEVEKVFIKEEKIFNSFKDYLDVKKIDTNIYFYENNSEIQFVPNKIKNLFINGKYKENLEFYIDQKIFKFYNIATDITRSMRNWKFWLVKRN